MYIGTVESCTFSLKHVYLELLQEFWNLGTVICVLTDVVHSIHQISSMLANSKFYWWDLFIQSNGVLLQLKFEMQFYTKVTAPKAWPTSSGNYKQA